MKTALTTTALLVLSTLSSFAETGSGFDVLREGGRTSARLEHCGGTAQLTQQHVDGKKRPVLMISGVTDCSNISIDGESQGKLDRRGDKLSGKVVVYEKNGKNIHTIKIESNSGATADTVRVETFQNSSGSSSSNPRANIVFEFGWFSHVLGASQSSALSECGGSVEARVLENDITLVFKDVKRCSKFDILGANGEAVDYPQKRLNDSRDGSYNGSFSVPQKLIQSGGNAVKVIIRSNSGINDDVILIRFKAL